MSLKSNPAYSKLFSVAEKQTVEVLKESFTLLYVMSPASFRSLSMAVIMEELENRIGKVEANNFLDSFE